MRLYPAEDDLQVAAADGDLTAASVDDVKAAQRLRQLELVARAGGLRERPRYVGKRDA